MRRRVKKSGQSRFWKKPLIAMAAIALLGALLLAATVHYFLKSSELERGLEKITGQVLRADVSIKPWEWNGAWFSSDALTLRGWEDSHFKNAEGFHVRLGWNWRALFSGVFQLEEISIDEVQAEFQSPSKSQSSRKNDVFIPLPLRFQLDRIVIGRVRILYQNVSANGLKLLLTPQANGELKISGSGGVLHVPKLPRLDIQSVQCREVAGKFYLEESQLTLSRSGSISATGQSGPDGALHVDWSGLPARRFLGETFGKYLDGTLSGTCDWEASGRAKGNFQIENATIDNLSFLDEAAALTGIPALQKLPVQALSANFDYQNEEVKFSNVILESRGVLKVEGSLWIKPDGAMSGNLQLGVAPNFLTAMPGARESVFTVQRGGYFWTPVKLGGTLEVPREDLSPRLAPIIASSLLLKNAPQVLEAVPAPAIDAIKGMLDIFLPSGR
jgi:hypothetical protein